MCFAQSVVVTWQRTIRWKKFNPFQNFHLIINFLVLFSNPTVSSSDACWRGTSPGSEGRPETPQPGSAHRWPTPKMDPRMLMRGARALRMTQPKRGSLWRRARGASDQTRRMITAKLEPDNRPRSQRARTARPASQL